MNEKGEQIYPKPGKPLSGRRWKVTYSGKMGTTVSYFNSYLVARLDMAILCGGSDPLYENGFILDQRPERPML